MSRKYNQRRPSAPAADTPSTGLPASVATRLVWNPFLGEFTGQAPARMNRHEQTTECPFCADLTTGRVPRDAQAWIRPNDFPALQPPTGECHMLIYSADHDRSFADLTLIESLRVLGLWRQVYETLAPRYQTVMTWETSGVEIGQTQFHPHGQTYGIATVPDMLQRELAAVQRAATEEAMCPFCAERAAEEVGPRLVHAGAHWTAFVPAYARYPYQVRITPRRHVPAVGDIAGEGPEAEELMDLLLHVVRAYHRLYQAPMPYMLALHQLAAPCFHFHVELLPVGRAPGKLKIAASSEMAWGLWLNDSVPEAKAAELRATLAEE
jgi:UDPglucose--hexose-1-phosphate uridylyltransferase